MTVERLKVFSRDDEFRAYAGLGWGVRAYYSPSQRETVTYYSGGKGESLGVLRHELTHRYLHFICDLEDLAEETGEGEEEDEEGEEEIDLDYMARLAAQVLPIWINEGFAEYFNGTKWDGKRMLLGDMLWGRLQAVRDAIRSDSHTPFPNFFKLSQREHYANAGVNYAEGWAFVHFTFHTKDRRYRGLCQKFMEVLVRDQDPEKAYEETFGEIDMAQMEEVWKEYTLNEIQKHKP